MEGAGSIKATLSGPPGPTSYQGCCSSSARDANGGPSQPVLRAGSRVIATARLVVWSFRRLYLGPPYWSLCCQARFWPLKVRAREGFMSRGVPSTLSESSEDPAPVK